MKCLICDWVGCLECSEGGAVRHTKEHGSVAPFMRMKDTMAIIMNGKDARRNGFLYSNEWGDGFRVSKDWKDFTFQEETYQKIKINLVCEE